LSERPHLENRPTDELKDPSRDHRRDKLERFRNTAAGTVGSRPWTAVTSGTSEDRTASASSWRTLRFGAKADASVWGRYYETVSTVIYRKKLK
jgi:hypothetical protein